MIYIYIYLICGLLLFLYYCIFDEELRDIIKDSGFNILAIAFALGGVGLLWPLLLIGDILKHYDIP